MRHDYVACYRHRVGPPDDGGEMTRGEWHGTHISRPVDRPVMYMNQALPLVEAALADVREGEGGIGAEPLRRELVLGIDDDECLHLFPPIIVG